MGDGSDACTEEHHHDAVDSERRQGVVDVEIRLKSLVSQVVPSQHVCGSDAERGAEHERERMMCSVLPRASTRNSGSVSGPTAVKNISDTGTMFSGEAKNLAKMSMATN